MAPEVLEQKGYTSKVDIWSIGVIIYRLFVGFAPFWGKNLQNLAQNIKKGLYGIPKQLEVSLGMLNILHK